MQQVKPLWNGFEYKPHQIAGVTWMMGREKEEVAGGILCDEMGLGKTIEIIGLIRSAVKKPGEKNLLVAPVAVLEQWKKAARRAGVTVMVPHESGVFWVPEGEVQSKLASLLHCIGYESAKRKRWLVTMGSWDRLIYDEAHRLASKNGSTEVAMRIKASKKWMLSGTPIVNKLEDLVVLLELVGLENVPRSMDRLKPIIETYVLARSMEQLRSSMPDAPLKPIHVSKQLPFLTEEEGKFYSDKTDVIARRLQYAGNNTLEKLKLIMRLRQVSLHPQIYNESRRRALKGLWDMPDWEGTSTKFEGIRKLIVENEESHKWILFCHFKDEMRMLEEMLLAESKVELVQQYHGGLTAEEKESVIEKTHMPVMGGKQEVLLVQLQSGGTGLNLQHFDRIIFSGPWWTKALMEQAVGRAVRIGQTKQVYVYHLLLEAEDNDERINIDRLMSEKAEGKGELCKKVLESATRALRVEELNTHS